MFPLRDSLPSRTVPFVTYALIAANVTAFLAQASMHPYAAERFIHAWGVTPSSLLRTGAAAETSPLWTLLTYMFLHGGWGHLLSNMWALWLFGDNVEDRFGHARYLLFYVTCGILAALTHVLLQSHSAVPTVGASGAIAGVMGAYFLMFPHARMIVVLPIFFYPLFFEVPAALYLFFWILSQVLTGTVSLLAGGGSVGGVAFWAHVGGFVAGLLFARRRHYRGRPAVYYFE